MKLARDDLTADSMVDPTEIFRQLGLLPIDTKEGESSDHLHGGIPGRETDRELAHISRFLRKDAVKELLRFYDSVSKTCRLCREALSPQKVPLYKLPLHFQEHSGHMAGNLNASWVRC